MLTQDQLKSILHYCPDTGVFTFVKHNKSTLVGKPSGYLNARGYVRIHMKGLRYQAHRLAFLYMTGAFPENDVDHINHICSDNRWSNLRPATKSQNMANTRKPIGSKCEYRGVHPYNKKWCASISHKSKRKHLGTFDTPEEAHEAYKKAALELHGEFANVG